MPHTKHRTTKARIRDALAPTAEATFLLDKGRLTHQAEQDFAAALELQIDDGYGFIPFIGAGLSSPSGVPLIVDIKPYLQRCIAAALGVEGGQQRPWNPRTDQWPPFGATNRNAETKCRHRIQEKIDQLNREDPWDHDISVFQEAIGAIAEWRTALQFLSRIDHDERGTNFSKRVGFVLDEPRQEVIDACLRTILKGKYPTLGHRMLAALGGLLRLNVILTTNFDNLLELAFAEARNPLTVFEVHLGSSLPAWSAIGTQRSLIKLHGNRHSLRADYTLDAAPSEKDLTRFVDYLTGGESLSRSNTGQCARRHARNHLLMVGVSAAERRTGAFIRHAWRCVQGFKVFWICHTPQDVKRVEELTENYKRSEVASGEPWLGSIIVRHSNPGLLFTEIYQSIRHTIPPSGIAFPSTSRLSIPPLAPSPERNTDQDECGQKQRQWLLELLNGLVGTSPSASPRLLAVTSEKEMHGLTSLCAHGFEHLEGRAACVWIDLNDVANTDDLFEQLLDAIHFRLGAESWLPVFIAEDAASRADEIRRVAALTTRPWVVFLNARETPGSNRPGGVGVNAPPNGWIDNDEDVSSGDATANRVAFVSLLTQLCPSNAGTPSISVVLLCRSNEANGGDASSAVADELKVRGLVRDVEVVRESVVDLNPETVATDCTNWMNGRQTCPESVAQRRFLHRLVLMQRTRFLSCIWMKPHCDGESAGTGNHNVRHDEWIAELATIGLVRRKLGGFIWLHTRSRDRLRSKLAGHTEDLSQLHWELARWYHRILLASGSPHALFEGIYHACRSAEACWHIGKDVACMDACVRIGWATDALRQNSFLVQTIGYSRGSCRRLESIRDELCKLVCVAANRASASEFQRRGAVAVKRLQIACTELMRAIAREVGEVTRAYERHRELRALLVENDPKKRDGDGLQQKFIDQCGASDNDGSFIPAIELVRWWKWNGMLGIASRSYDSARKALLAGLQAAQQNGVAFPDVTADSDVDEQALNTLREVLTKCRCETQQFLGKEYKSGDAARLRLEILRTAEQYVACRLQQENAGRHVGKESTTDLHTIGQCTSLALEIADYISGGTVEGGFAALVALCRSRLFLHQGHIAAYKNEHHEAMNSFTDAEAALNLCELRRFDCDRAVVELYRAEVRLSEADTVPVKIAAREGPFRELIDTIVEAAEGPEDFFSKLNELLPHDEALGDAQRSSFRRAGAVGRDAIRFLDRAEDIFARRRRNTAITTWYFHRRLRSVSLAVWASLTDRGGPIPFLGVEAAPEGTETMADALVDQALRLIRADAYRLATIVDEYSRCAIALRARLARDCDVPRLTQRQRDMCAKLDQAVSKLKHVFETRTAASDVDKYKDKRALSTEVKTYCKDVIKDCTVRSRKLKHIVT